MSDKPSTESVHNSYEAVLFDMDGVLIQGPSTPSEVYQNAADDVIEFFELSVTESQRAKLGAYRYNEKMRATCRELGIDPEEFWAARERFACRRSNRRLQGGSRPPYPDTETLEGLSVPLAIVSNNRDATVKFVADHLFPRYFAVARGRDRTAEGFQRRKPESDYIDEVLAELGVERALFVGDREADVIGAHRAGIDAAFLRRDHNGQVTPEETPEADIESLEELPALLEG